MKSLEHGRVRIALRELRPGPGPALLAVHGLRGSSEEWGDSLASWKGAVHALDLTGHGESARLAGGAYHPELLAGDVDVAIAATAARHLVGRGLGAYLALLVAGSRADRIDGALLLPGDGIEGGGPEPVFDDLAERFAAFHLRASGAVDGRADPALSALETDIRPPAYATSFARRARRLLLAEDGSARPPWWTAIRELGTAQIVSTRLPDALAALAP